MVMKGIQKRFDTTLGWEVDFGDVRQSRVIKMELIIAPVWQHVEYWIMLFTLLTCEQTCGHDNLALWEIFKPRCGCIILTRGQFIFKFNCIVYLKQK